MLNQRNSPEAGSTVPGYGNRVVQRRSGPGRGHVSIGPQRRYAFRTREGSRIDRTATPVRRSIAIISF